MPPVRSAPCARAGLGFSRPLLVAVVLLLGVAAGGCSDEPGFTYGAAEMEFAITGAWEGSLTTPTQTDIAVTLNLQHGTPRATPACGSRVLNHPQCIDTSSMHVVGTIAAEAQPPTSLTVDGSFEVWGLDLTSGLLYLAASDGSSWHAAWSGGTALDDGMVSGGVHDEGAFTLHRVPAK